MRYACSYLSFFIICAYILPQLKLFSTDLQYDVDVLVIGAGVAGSTFARELARNGIRSFLILEARNETGGRFINVKIGNVSVELGPNWIHGTTNNPIFDLVKTYRISGQFENPRSLICRDIHGKDVTATFLKKREKLKSLLRTFREKYTFMSLRDALMKNGWENRTAIENIAEYSLIDFMDAGPPEVISGYSQHSDNSRINSLDGPQFFITEQGGYKKLVQGILKEALGEDTERLKLNTFVKKIKWNRFGVTVETSQGKLYRSKLLLATPSMGVYQNMKDLFEPAFPAWKEEAIQKFIMGTYTKIFLKFPYRFWDNVEYIFFASGTRHLFPVWQSLDAGNKFNFDTNILMVTVTWSESYRLEKLSKNNLIEEILAQLRFVYGSNVIQPIDIVVPKWKTNGLFYGSYSLLQKNVTHQDFVAIQSNVGPVFFAGEATHEVYQGYIHGAFYEGRNRAFDMMQALKGYFDIDDDRLNKDFYDSCLRDSCDCCYN